ncbi:MAG: RNA polymerase sigma factor [Parcubacteria group bacterium GW2011_GWB1_44_7]|nr:MAG: RNA polymerase sigma factor [Parcubacteria group bacterium GW2011_GWB1_44_7]
MTRPSFETMSDEDLLALSTRNPKAFETIVGRYQEAFIRKSRYLLGDGEEAKDLTQEAFVKIYLNAKRFHPVPGASFKSWGYKILINTCLTYLKKRNRESAVRLDLEPEFYEILPDKSVADIAEKSLFIDEALRVISKMPDAFADILRLVLIEGKSYDDVSKELGLSPGAVRTRIHRAKEEFKKISAALMR